MPKSIDRDLLDMLRRPNPNVLHHVEISAPDVGLILRRPDQFLGSTSKMVPGSMTPANSLVSSALGSLELVSTPLDIASFSGTQSLYDLNRENPQRRLKGMRWTLDTKFGYARLRNFRARVTRTGIGFAQPAALDFALDIFQITQIPGAQNFQNGTSVSRIEYAFVPVVSVIVKASSINWVAGAATIDFPLSNYGVVIHPGDARPVSPERTGDLPAFYFVVRPVNPPAATGFFHWKIDTASSRTITDVGTFERVFWARENENEEWKQDVFNDVPSCTVTIDTYPASASAIYEIDLGRVPSDGTIGRLVSLGRFPRGTSTTTEISYAGSGGPWTLIKNEDVIPTSQQVYHLRVTLHAGSG